MRAEVGEAVVESKYRFIVQNGGGFLVYPARDLEQLVFGFPAWVHVGGVDGGFVAVVFVGVEVGVGVRGIFAAAVAVAVARRLGGVWGFEIEGF